VILSLTLLPAFWRNGEEGFSLARFEPQLAIEEVAACGGGSSCEKATREDKFILLGRDLTGQQNSLNIV